VTATHAPPIPSQNPLLASLPPAFACLRPWQAIAVTEVLEAFDRGDKVVVLDAPTGVGKTVIAEVVRMMLDTTGTYICHNLELQSQFGRDFPYAKVLWGRANYTPVNHTMFQGSTCADCTRRVNSQECALCPNRTACPYHKAKMDAITAPVAVLNSAYWLSATLTHGSPFADRGLTVIDEADTFETVLSNQVSINVSEHARKVYNIPAPARMTKEDAYVEWANRTLECLLPQLRRCERVDTGEGVRKHLYLTNLVSTVQGMVDDLAEERRWVYGGGAGSTRRSGSDIIFRPVEVAQFGRDRIWRHGDRWLLMSGTVISADLLLSGLGYTGTGFTVVGVDSPFPARNRQVVVKNVADMGRRSQDNDPVGKMAEAIRRICVRHPGESVLVHTVSYARARELRERLGVGIEKPVLCYETGGDRGKVLHQFKRSPGALLLAPSMDRGVDLPDDLCRVQIITKMPFPNLGDHQMSERLHKTRTGNVWYQVQVARTVMQMCGRAVRHGDDHCVTYILDSGWQKWYRTWGHLLPKWFKVAVRRES
jgi:ATP-dependent DNA helicase DinG